MKQLPIDKCFLKPEFRHAKRGSEDIVFSEIDDVDETSSEQASEASTQIDSVCQFAGSKRARNVWTKTSTSRAGSGSQSLTLANIAAAGLEPASKSSLSDSSITTSIEPSNRDPSLIMGVPLPPHSQLAKVIFPQCHQTMMTSFTVQGRAGSRKNVVNLTHCIGEALSAEDGVDLLKLSVTLGIMSSSGDIAGTDLVNRIDSSCMSAVGKIRKIISDMQGSVSSFLESGNLRSVMCKVMCDAMLQFNPAGSFSEDGYPFLAVLTPGVISNYNSLARTTFCVCVWTLMRNELLESKRLPRMSACQCDGRWRVYLQSTDGSCQHYYDVIQNLENHYECVEVPCKILDSEIQSNRSIVEKESCKILAMHLLQQLLDQDHQRSIGKISKSKWFCTILELDKDRDLQLSRYLPFVEICERMLLHDQLAPKSVIALQEFCSRHLMQPTPSNRGQSDGAGPTERASLEQIFHRITVRLQAQRIAPADLASCSGSSVLKASIAAGQCADVLLRSEGLKSLDAHRSGIPPL